MGNHKPTPSKRHRKQPISAKSKYGREAEQGLRAARHSATSSRQRSKAASHRVSERYADPLSYEHPWPSMERYAQLLALRYDQASTRHAYYRHMRLIHEHFD